jgi:hypothetical protein
MPYITINEVCRRLQLFEKEHANDRLEKQYGQQFMRDFYINFGLSYLMKLNRLNSNIKN